jgi:hypothetical protein
VGGVAGFIGGGGVGALPGAATGAVGGAIGGAVTGGVSGFVNAIFADNAKDAFVGGVYWGGATGAAGGIIGRTARAGAAYTAGRAAAARAAAFDGLSQGARDVIWRYKTKAAAEAALEDLKRWRDSARPGSDFHLSLVRQVEKFGLDVEQAWPFVR